LHVRGILLGFARFIACLLFLFRHRWPDTWHATEQYFLVAAWQGMVLNAVPQVAHAPDAPPFQFGLPLPTMRAGVARL